MILNIEGCSSAAIMFEKEAINKNGCNCTGSIIIMFLNLQGCGMQLTDEPEKRCYPLNNRLFCYTCAKRTKSSPHPYSPNTIRASPAYYADRERPSTVSNFF